MRAPTPWAVISRAMVIALISIVVGMLVAYFGAIALPAKLKPKPGMTVILRGRGIDLTAYPARQWYIDHCVIRGDKPLADDSIDLRSVGVDRVVKLLSDEELSSWPEHLRMRLFASGKPWEFDHSVPVHTVTLTAVGCPARCAYAVDVNDKESINQGYPPNGPQKGYRVLWAGLFLNGLAYASPILVLWVVLAQITRSRRKATGFCSQCGYDLRGNVGGVCPECGLGAGPTPKGEMSSHTRS